MSTESRQDSSIGRLLDRAGLDQLLAVLRGRGYTVVGPRVRDRAIVYDEIDSTADMPVGLTDEQEGGRYRIKPRTDAALFGYAAGPHSWKKFLFPPVQKLFSVTRNGQALNFSAAAGPVRKLAFIGVRSCELSAIAVQDKVFVNGPFADSRYKGQRDNLFVLAVNCTEPGGTCFCVSMQTGPKAEKGFDLALTEFSQRGQSRFLVRVGTSLGGEVLEEVPSRIADESEHRDAESAMEKASARMGRTLDTTKIKELLYRHYEDKHWDAVAQRCLSCGNCTLVCPTCFCSTVEDVTDLTGQHADRWRKWDSCFNADFSYIHGGAIRSSIRSRYRQWMVHKLATWHDQFGTSGCVGCGRCITWCPVAIDITQEAAAIREQDAAAAATKGNAP